MYCIALKLDNDHSSSNLCDLYQEQAKSLGLSFFIHETISSESLATFISRSLASQKGIIFIGIGKNSKTRSLSDFYSLCQDQPVLQVGLENIWQSSLYFNVDEQNILNVAADEGEALKDFFYPSELFYLPAKNLPLLVQENISDLWALLVRLSSLCPVLATMDSFLFGPQRPCLFLDRDGIIIEDVGYPHKVADLALVPGIAMLIKKARSKGYLVVAITNQAGLAKGIFTKDQYDAFSRKLNEVLIEEKAPLDGLYYCPHHPEAKVLAYKRNCLCRKPMPGLVMKAQEEHGIDFQRSLFIGDKDSDIVSYLPIKTWLLKGKYELKSQSVPIFSSMNDLIKQFDLI